MSAPDRRQSRTQIFFTIFRFQLPKVTFSITKIDSMTIEPYNLRSETLYLTLVNELP